MSAVGRVLVTGASGYIGGRLVPRLVAAGHRVRCLARDPRRLPDGEAWGQVDLARGDVADDAALDAALEGVDQAYYLIHAMRDGGEDFRRRDRELAERFGHACARAGIGRIIYLGGLGDEDDPELSEHLRSRHEVGRALTAGGVPVLEFRAAVIVGSGSASFEMLRYLSERLPVMLCPRWVDTRCQPIGVADVLTYLARALRQPEIVGVYEIGGADVLSYRQMMLGYAAERGLRRWIVSVPVLTPSLSSRWVDLVTPIPRSIARPLIEGLRSEVVCRDQRAAALFGVDPIGYRQAVGRALWRLDNGAVETTWCSSLASLGDATADGELVLREGMVIERHARRVPVSADRVFAACAAVGGARGWPAGGSLWRLRGVLDRLVGGPGMRRGRRHPDQLREGDAVDFWRVERVRPGRLIRLRAEMLMPGRGWLDLRVEPDGPAACRLTAVAFFEPHGLLGHLYWQATKPLHRFVFPGLVDGLARRAQRKQVA